MTSVKKEAIYKSIFTSDKLLFCNDDFCESIKKILLLIFKDLNENNTLFFNNLDMTTLRDNFYENLNKAQSCKYYSTEKSDSKIVNKYLKLVDPKKNLFELDQKKKKKKPDIKVLISLLKKTEDLNYIKDIITLAQVKLVFIPVNLDIRYIVKVLIKTNIKISQIMYSVHIISICEKYTLSELK